MAVTQVKQNKQRGKPKSLTGVAVLCGGKNSNMSRILVVLKQKKMLLLLEIEKLRAHKYHIVT